MIGDACRYDNKFHCWKWNQCDERGLAICLKSGVVLMSRELDHLKHTKMQKHTASSIKWRNSSFYYKQKCKCLEALILGAGLALPSTPQLIETKNTLKLKGDENDGIHNNDKEEVSPKGVPTPPSEKPIISNKPSSPIIPRPST